MKLLFILLLVTYCGLSSGERLESVYLPPLTAYSAGGNENFLTAPRQSFPAPSTYYIPAVQTSYKSYRTEPPVPILKSNFDNNGFGSYRFEYETGNGIHAQETGSLKNGDTNVVHGSYSYIGPDGVQYTVTYTADENGFHPHGAHLPVLPETVARTPQYSNARPQYNYYRQNDGHYQDSGSYYAGRVAPPARDYLTPRKPTFSTISGYNY